MRSLRDFFRQFAPNEEISFFDLSSCARRAPSCAAAKRIKQNNKEISVVLIEYERFAPRRKLHLSNQVFSPLTRTWRERNETHGDRNLSVLIFFCFDLFDWKC